MCKLLIGKNPYSHAWKPDNLPSHLTFKCFRLQIDVRNDDDDNDEVKLQAADSYSRKFENPAPSKKPRLTLTALRKEAARSKQEKLQRLRYRIETPTPIMPRALPMPSSSSDPYGGSRT